MKTVLITGISGFAGSHLAEYLILKKEYHIRGTYLSDRTLQNISAIRNKINLVKIDLTHPKKVFDLVAKTKADLIFHLAGLPSTADSFKNPNETIINNIALEINILAAVQKNNLLNTKVLIVSSADVYGLVKKEDLPIDEETKLMPSSPYAVSKIAQDFLGLVYFLSYNIKTIRVRPFNHIGPRQASGFVVSDIARKIAEIEKGKRDAILSVGNLETRRDFTDVRDMVVAYVEVLAKGKTGDVYNIGSQRSYKISEILSRLLSLSKSKIKIKIDKSLFRPSDTPDLVCDARKCMNLTGWKPKIPINTTLKDTLDYWRNIV